MAVPPASDEAHDAANALVEPSSLSGVPPAVMTSSSDSEDQVLTPPDPAQEDEFEEVIGFSMSRAQSRMKARLTPAEEKNRIMEQNGGYFSNVPDRTDNNGLFVAEISEEPEPLPDTNGNDTDRPPASPASRQTADDVDGSAVSKESGSRSSFTRSILKNGLPLRPRAWSGDAVKKFLPDLGSLTKRSSLSFRSSPFDKRSRSQTLKPSSSRLALDDEDMSRARSRRRSCTDPSPPEGDVVDEPISDLKPLKDQRAAKHSYSRRPSATVSGAPPMLRRSSSDHSLYLQASSTASSLEQRPLYENIHTQVNSRFKAIKDSLQDSSSRLLSMPTLHLQDLRSDWGYKPFVSDVAHRKGNNYMDESRFIPDSGEEQMPQARPPRTNSNGMHPILNEAISEMTGDVVIMGGYRGSVLRSAKPPQRQLWVPMKVGLNLRKVDLEVGLHPEDEERMEETIIPSGVLSHVGPVDICRRLMKRLSKSENAARGDLRVHDYGYDWRLSPHLLSRKLIKFLEGLPCNAPDVPREKRGAYVVAHSLGGLIARHAVNQRPELFAGVLYAGVPQHCVNILGPMRNGDDVLLSSRVLTAQVNFTFRTSFALLPEDGHCFIDKRTKEEYRIDFFNPQAWDEWRLSPVINQALPPLTNRGFIDNIPRLGKRFSAVLGSRENLSSEDAPEDENPSPGVPNGRNSPRSATNPGLAHELHDKASAMAPNVDGVVGPTSNLRGSSNVKTTTAVTIPRAKAFAYLERTLPEVLRFKQELHFNPSHQSNNRYPPFAVLYGKSVPTVYGARIWTREQIKHQDAYDDLAFAAGDGVCLASAAMLPPGYRIIKDGLVKSDRGHVGLLGDLEGTGQCLRALIRGRREGVGYDA